MQLRLVIGYRVHQSALRDKNVRRAIDRATTVCLPRRRSNKSLAPVVGSFQRQPAINAFHRGPPWERNGRPSAWRTTTSTRTVSPARTADLNPIERRGQQVVTGGV